MQTLKHGTSYECLPWEIRATIWKYRATMRKDAATIIFRNFARHLITGYLNDFLEEMLSEQESSSESEQDFDPHHIGACAGQYNSPFACLDRSDGLHIYDPSFVTDWRNVLLDYSLYYTEEGSVDLTDDIRMIWEIRKDFPFYFLKRAQVAALLFAKLSTQRAG